MYLNRISICDLLLLDNSAIHPSYLSGHRPPSRISSITWPPIPNPPKKYWGLWGHFNRYIITPLISRMKKYQGLSSSALRFRLSFYKHHHSPHHYHLSEDGALTQFRISTNLKSRRKAVYPNVPYICEYQYSSDLFKPVDVFLSSKGYQVISNISTANNTEQTAPKPHTLGDAFKSLPSALQRLCGTIQFPHDNGIHMIATASQQNITLFAASDASLKENRVTHAWIISTGQINDINESNLNIRGFGPVNGYHMSSGRAELGGITVVAIIFRLFVQYHSSTMTLLNICDNKGIINKSNSHQFNRLCSHRTPNTDLFLTQRDISTAHNISYAWIRGHADSKPWDTIEETHS